MVCLPKYYFPVAWTYIVVCFLKIFCYCGSSLYYGLICQGTNPLFTELILWFVLLMYRSPVVETMLAWFSFHSILGPCLHDSPFIAYMWLQVGIAKPLVIPAHVAGTTSKSVFWENHINEHQLEYYIFISCITLLYQSTLSYLFRFFFSLLSVVA